MTVMTERVMTEQGMALDGSTLMGFVADGVRHYYFGERLVAKAVGNLEEVSMTRYFCLQGIWNPDQSCFVVSPEELSKI